MVGDGLELLHRRIIAFVLLAWVPLLLLSIVEGHAWGGSGTLPFLYHVELPRPPAVRAAVADSGGADCARADAPDGAAVFWRAA